MLVYRNRKLGVLEAKAWDEPLTEGVGQAKNYAGKLAIRFAFASNGQGIYRIDMETGREGELPQYPAPEELWNLTFAEANAWRDRFSEVPFEDKGGSHPSRYYQDIAVERVMEAIGSGVMRILLTLATGTGKTFIAFQVAWKLFYSRWNLSREPSRRPRILFLADRNILANQAYNAFSAFPEDAMVRIEPEDIRKKGKVPKNGSLFFTIFQTFISGPPRDGQPSPYFGDYPPDFFDFIVIDECHRGGANDESNFHLCVRASGPRVRRRKRFRSLAVLVSASWLDGWFGERGSGDAPQRHQHPRGQPRSAFGPSSPDRALVADPAAPVQLARLAEAHSEGERRPTRADARTACASSARRSVHLVE